jgi:hypothetical protein
MAPNVSHRLIRMRRQLTGLFLVFVMALSLQSQGVGQIIPSLLNVSFPPTPLGEEYDA